MTDDTSAKLRAAGFDAPPQSILSSDAGLFALASEQLAYLGAGGLQSVALREITRIHSDREGLLRVETAQGPRITSSLIGFEPGAVQEFFNQVKVATNQAKNLPNSPQATPTGSGNWKSGWAVDPSTRPATPAAGSPAAQPDGEPVSPAPEGAGSPADGAAPVTVVPPAPDTVLTVSPSAPASLGIGDAPLQPPSSPPPGPVQASPAQPAAAQQVQPTRPAPIRTAPPASPEPAGDEAFEETVTVLSRPPEPAAPPVELSKPAPRPPEAGRAEPSRPTVSPTVTPVVISTAPSPAPRVSAAPPPPAAREVDLAPAPSGEVLRQAESVARFAGTLRLLALALGLAAVLVGVLRFLAGQTVDGLWTLGTGVVGAFALLVFAQVAQLLALMARAGQRGE